MGNTVEITELPVGTWTQNYKENVLQAMQGSDKVKNDKSKDKDKDKAKDKVKDKCKWSIQVQYLPLTCTRTFVSK